MDIGVRLRPPNPGAFGESEEKKVVGASDESSHNKPKLSTFSKILPPFD